MQHLRHEDGTGHGGVEGLGSAAEVGDGDGAVTHSLTCGVRPRPSLPTTSTEPLESEGRGDGEPQRFCPSNRGPTTGIGKKVGIEHFGAEKAAHGALHHFGDETGDGAIAVDDAPHTEPVGGADDGAQVA